jgi:hypothetical protein
MPGMLSLPLTFKVAQFVSWWCYPGMTGHHSCRRPVYVCQLPMAAAQGNNASQATLIVQLLLPLQVDEGGWGQSCSPVLMQLREAMARREEQVTGGQQGWPPLRMPF